MRIAILQQHASGAVVQWIQRAGALAFVSTGHGFESRERLFFRIIYRALAFSKLRSLMKCQLPSDLTHSVHSLVYMLQVHSAEKKLPTGEGESSSTATVIVLRVSTKLSLNSKALYLVYSFVSRYKNSKL